MENLTEVYDQLRGHGLIVPSIETGRIVRCAVEGDREKRGWYILHEMPIDGGKSLLVGSYGIWHGNDNGAIKIELDKKQQLSDEQKQAIKKRLAEDRKKAAAARKHRNKIAASKADSAWRKGSESGHCDYLDKKQVQGIGVRYTENGAMMIPMLDTSGQIHGLQFIFDSVKGADKIQKFKRNKTYWPEGLDKKGHFHLIGSPVDLILVAEGYATAASLYMATGLPVAVAFDAHNLKHVAENLKKRYSATILICADDDSLSTCSSCSAKIDINPSTDCPQCGQPHGKKNTGIQSASLAAMELGCHWIPPEFTDKSARLSHYQSNKGKLTDFNDLHLIDGLHTVRTQIDAALDRFGIRGKLRASAGGTKQGERGDGQLRPIDTVDELIERFALVYGKGGMVFDRKEHILLTTSDMRDACQSRELSRRWQESPLRQIVRAENVGFDPSEEDPNITCNLWSGWPTQPKKGSCEVLLDLLDYICREDDRNSDMFEWVLKWLAFPIQNPGAKMKTSLVIHGPQGTGKNLFFECVMKIYGCYGRILNQDAVEDKFNDWASKKLFLIADEVVARSDLYHVKNKLKNFITGDWIRINPKNMSAYEERNHVNMVFLSNERMPVVLEEDDRRYAVIWTPPKLEKQFYIDIAAEIKAGGIEALHDYLLNYPIDGFNEHTKPPLNKAKQELINLSKDNVLRFYDDWRHGEIDHIPHVPVLSDDLYDLYKHWSSKQGHKAAPLNRVIDTLSKRPGMSKVRKRYLNGTVQSNPKFFLFPEFAKELPPGNSESGWLGECVKDFKDALKELKGVNYD